MKELDKTIRECNKLFRHDRKLLKQIAKNISKIESLLSDVMEARAASDIEKPQRP
ncbi:hypothetical protein ES703_125011 [subsurface metagenome]